MLLYHASPTPDIARLEPRISNHDKPLIYFSQRRENTLVYLSNAIERYCKSIGFAPKERWHKWASYGFDKQGIFVLDEYYENAVEETYKGVAGYIYCVNANEGCKPFGGIPYAYISEDEMKVESCEFVSDAYEALLKAESEGLIRIRRYNELSQGTHEWIEKTIRNEYANAKDDYKLFLEAKFKDVL